MNNDVAVNIMHLLLLVTVFIILPFVAIYVIMDTVVKYYAVEKNQWQNLNKNDTRKWLADNPFAISSFEAEKRYKYLLADGN